MDKKYRKCVQELWGVYEAFSFGINVTYIWFICPNKIRMTYFCIKRLKYLVRNITESSITQFAYGTILSPIRPEFIIPISSNFKNFPIHPNYLLIHSYLYRLVYVFTRLKWTEMVISSGAFKYYKKFSFLSAYIVHQCICSNQQVEQNLIVNKVAMISELTVVSFQSFWQNKLFASTARTSLRFLSGLRLILSAL